MFVICVVGWVTKNLMYNKFSYYFIRQVKYWWFRGDWYSLLLRELNYVFVAFDFTSRQIFCNLGRQQFVSQKTSSRRSKLQRQAFCNLGRQVLSPVRQENVSPNYRMFAYRWNQKLQKHNLVVSPNYRMIVSVIWSDGCSSPMRQRLISLNYSMFA